MHLPKRATMRLIQATSLPLLLLTAACGSEGGNNDDRKVVVEKGQYSMSWFEEQTIDERGTLSIPRASEWLLNERLVSQLEEYDPGSTARCAVEDDATYAELLDELGGARWNYSVSVIPDTSTPRFQMGIRDYYNSDPSLASDASAESGVAVEIAEADIVGVSETSALFLSTTHGLLMVDLSGDEPVFDCAAKLPGEVDQFYLHNGRLVIIVQDAGQKTSHLLHFSVAGDELAFVESVALGHSRVLDSRRFNDRLVLYTDLDTNPDEDTSSASSGSLYGGIDIAYEPNYVEPNQNRILRVYNWGDTLTEELTETHLDDTPSEDYLAREDFDRDTPLGTIISSSSHMGTSMWASDRYFVVSESTTDTSLTGWETRHYSVCVEHHSEPYTYQSCHTDYETRPNPNYTEPDNSGGDRSCSGTTLSSCIRKVARESSKTIRVPVGRTCEMVEASRFICDSRESRSHTYPLLDRDTYTNLHIYEYTDDGFIRFSDEVTDVDADNLTTTNLDDTVDNLALNEEAAELRIYGSVQAIQFQNGYLYVISSGDLQTYALAENSLLRTSQLQLTNDASLQSMKFTPQKLYLSDGDWHRSGEESVLRVIDLENAAFPVQSSVDRTLPGSHQLILPTASGILTTGYVNRFEDQDVDLIKVGLFEDPSTVELSYLFLGTDLEYPRNGEDDASFFDTGAERLFWPYNGREFETEAWRYRVGVNHIEGTEIVSEGAVDLSQPAERIRPRPGTGDVLSFASSSIQTLRDAGAEWEATPVFEYYTPAGVYRLNDEEDYVELLRLGNRCKLHFANVTELNERRDDDMSEAFLCGTYGGVGYKQNLLFTEKLAIHFEHDGTIEQLSVGDATDLWEKSQSRDICLFKDELLPADESTLVDPFDPPNLDDMFCLSLDDYNLFSQQLREASEDSASSTDSASSSVEPAAPSQD